MQTNMMKPSLIIAALLFLAACNSGSDLSKKKAELEKLKDQVTKLESEITKLDTAAAKAEKAKLVSIASLAPVSFSHYIDLQGKIESTNISYIAPRNGTGGVVKALYVKRGDNVKKGQLLLKLDDAIARQSVVTAEQGLEALKTQLAYAENIAQKQQNLWDQKIGTEVQLITAKSNVQILGNQLKTSEEQLKITREQLQFTNVYSDVDGIAETVNVRVGEMFVGSSLAGVTQIVIVNNSNLKATAQIPENYLGSVKVGSKVKISLPDINKTIEATITVAGKSIDAANRSFFIEAKIPTDKDIRPNQIAMVKILDYTATNTLTVPVNTLQSDDKGKFVMIASKENGKLIARKKIVSIGSFYEDKMEIKSGLQVGDNIITEGFQNLYEGQLITLDGKL